MDPISHPGVLIPIHCRIDGTIQLRSLRVVTQSATLESSPAVRAIVWRNQHSSKRLRVVSSGRVSLSSCLGVTPITVPSAVFDTTR